MKTKHPSIITIFVPGGCTGIWQPLDVGIQRVMKQSMRRSSHRDLVAEATASLATAQDPSEVRITKKVGVLRDRAVGWIVDAIADIDKKDLILKVRTRFTWHPLSAYKFNITIHLKAFEMCRVGDFNCSHASMTSSTTLAALRSLRTNYPDLHEELEQGNLGSSNDGPEERAFTVTSTLVDSSDIPVQIVADHVTTGQVPPGFTVNKDNNAIQRTGSLEDVEKIRIFESPSESEQEAVEGRGHRIKRKPKPFGGDSLWDT